MMKPLFAFFLLLIAFTSNYVNVGAAESPNMPPVLLQMIRDDAVHEELNLDPSQREKIIAALQEVDGRWFRSRNMKPDLQREEIEALTSTLRTRVSDFLNSNQLSRLEQLECQALGTRMVLLPSAGRALQLKTQQLVTLTELFANTDRESASIQKKMQAGDMKSDKGNRELERLKAKERNALVSQLDSDQKSRLGSLTGKPFNFGQVRRMYPMAPELDPSGVTWIQGGPLSLEDLRGKVVAVHFYAFQCINCQRNFPHYKGWHDDYADKDLVIIGIQTPETPSERKLDRVTAAVKSDGMEYPVLLDAQSSNWKAWSNTMWPTVYLIDKKGFIRRWWQGEMNWQGTPGEQQMRDTVEALLAEDS